MSHRSRDWNESLALELKNITFAREFVLSALDEDISLQMILNKVVRLYGVKEFAAKAGMAAPNLIRVLRTSYNPTQNTLNKILKPLGLKLAVVPLVKGISRKKSLTG